MANPPSKTSNPPVKVILADDDQDDQILFQDAIESLNLSIELIPINHGKELIEYFDNPMNPIPDIIFLDLNMPYLSGLDCLPILRKMEALKTIPIAIYSTSSSKRDMEESLIRGANIYINKPHDFSKLKLIIKKVMEINWQYMNSDFDPDTFVMSI
ncbi:response regulator [Algoriphagus litoralis]|uniref:response regulator n=1 Tax=Algoriphagus litoralis TaxID=2202829 RepID=UPI000DB921B6|nr:response regulator [Algoriphagus litoralis]